MLTATWVQAATYLLGVALFSISFLVFLNSSVSFVITDIVRQHKGIGDAVGTLGFADELVALVFCPTWGMLSDRIGVRIVSVKRLLERDHHSDTIRSGFGNRIYYHGAFPIPVRSSPKCLSPATSREDVVQRGWSSYGHNGHCHLALNGGNFNDTGRKAAFY